MHKFNNFLLAIGDTFIKWKNTKVFKMVLLFLFDWNIGLGLFIRDKRGAAIRRFAYSLIFLSCWLMWVILHGLSPDETKNYLPITNAGMAFYWIAIFFLVLNMILLAKDFVEIAWNKNFQLKQLFWFNKHKLIDKNVKSDEQIAFLVTRDLGGIKNLETVDACITKLRITVIDPSKVTTDAVNWNKNNEALGFVIKGQGVQIAYGARAETLKGIILIWKARPEKLTAFANKVDQTLLTKKIDHLQKLPLKNLNILAPLKGQVFKIDKCSDELFANKSIGDGVFIKPSSGKVIAPFDGKIISTFPTNHAFGIEAEDGTQVLIHIGIDSFKTKDIFKSEIEQGQIVKASDVLCTFDIVKLKKLATSIESPIIVLPETLGERDIRVMPKSSKYLMQLILKDQKK